MVNDMTSLTCHPLGNYRAKWGEGPVWADNILWYVDIEGHAIATFDLATGHEYTWPVDERVGTIVPARNGGFLIAGDSGIRTFNSNSGVGSTLADPESTLRGHTRFNDGKCDPSGRFWAGTISLRKQPEAALYMLDQHGELHKKLTGVTNSNGLCWSHDRRTMFYIDTPTKKISTFDYNDTSGEISRRQTLVDTAACEIPGVPDGMTIDADGHLWVAFCHGGCVIRFHAATGAVLARIDVPAIETTACTFGGANLSQLYITTGLPKEGGGNLDGSLFVCEPGVYGVPAFSYQANTQ